MKKILTILTILIVSVTAFAYEPKKECAKVKRNGNVVYYEKTVPYDINGFKPDPKYGGDCVKDYDKWVIRKGYTVERCVEYNYGLLEHFRWGYKYNMKRVESPEVLPVTKIVVDFQNEVNGTSETYEEHTANLARESAWYEKRTAVISIPFVTEDNFLTLTKEEMLARMLDFIEEVKAENK